MELHEGIRSLTQKQEFKILVILLFSILIDVLWFIFIYLSIINTNDYNALAKWERGIQKCTFVVMIINFFLKIIFGGLIFWKFRSHRNFTEAMGQRNDTAGIAL